MIYGTDEIRKSINSLGQKGVPFLFVISYDQNNAIVLPLDELTNSNIIIDINGFKNYNFISKSNTPVILKKYPINYSSYLKAFQTIKDHLHNGDSYLLNLTFRTNIDLNLSLDQIFYRSIARFKILTPDFVVFSPEIFIKIKDKKIYSFPMRGTIDASVPDAENVIMNDYKEKGEHTTIVDLIRNDLSMIARDVQVDKFRYIDKVTTHDKTILHVSSQISGNLLIDFQKNIGDLLFSVLPAGSVTGAPKKKTMEIISDVEDYDRGFYTGVFGYYDGENLDSGVMIRYIEKVNDKFYYKSGRGITANSNPESEYQEMIDKIYVPVY